VPKQERKQGSRRIRQNISGICAGVRYEARTDPFKQGGPEDKVQDDLGAPRRIIVPAQAKTSMEPEERRQGARDQPKIVKMSAEEAAVDERPHEARVHDVRGATREKQWI